jgi:ribose 5-phosphate isomerase B
MNVVLISDHAGFDLKGELKPFVETLGHAVSDHGVFTADRPADDYPILAADTGRRIAAGEFDRGIFICGTGIGMTIAANKVPGVRAALCNELFGARKSREHNNANVCGLGARIIGVELAREIVRTWLMTEYEGGRHEGRMRKILDIERMFVRPEFIRE